jgi:hypothetical protein
MPALSANHSEEKIRIVLDGRLAVPSLARAPMGGPIGVRYLFIQNFDRSCPAGIDVRKRGKRRSDTHKAVFAQRSSALSGNRQFGLVMYHTLKNVKNDHFPWPELLTRSRRRRNGEDEQSVKTA